MQLPIGGWYNYYSCSHTWCRCKAALLVIEMATMRTPRHRGVFNPQSSTNIDQAVSRDQHSTKCNMASKVGQAHLCFSGIYSPLEKVHPCEKVMVTGGLSQSHAHVEWWKTWSWRMFYHLALPHGCLLMRGVHPGSLGWFLLYQDNGNLPSLGADTPSLS